MLNVRKIMGQMSSQVNRKLPKVTSSAPKAASKSEQAAFDYFQKATTSNQYPIMFNRSTRRLFNKLKIK